jgi:hypothetical protein
MHKIIKAFIFLAFSLLLFNVLSIASVPSSNKEVAEKYISVSGDETPQYLNDQILKYINREFNEKHEYVDSEIIKSISYIAKSLRMAGVNEVKFFFYKSYDGNALSLQRLNFSVLGVPSSLITDFFKTRVSKIVNLSEDGEILSLSRYKNDNMYDGLNEKNVVVDLTNFDKGLLAYNNGYYETAAKLWTPLAEEGHTIAQYNLGYMYYKGMGLKQDYAKGLLLLKKSASNGYAKAEYYLGKIYQQGLGVSKNLVEAKDWFHKSAEKGNILALYSLGDLYYSETDGYKDYKQALKWYGKAAEKGYDEAQFMLGWMYFNGLGVKEDYSTAAYWFGLAAEQGHYNAKQNLKLIKKFNDSMFFINRRSRE